MGQQEVLEFFSNRKDNAYWAVDDLSTQITCCTRSNVGRSCQLLHKAKMLDRIKVKHRRCTAAAYRLRDK